MPNTKCWHCDALTQHELKASTAANSANDPNMPEDIIAAYGAYQCTSCRIFAVGISWFQKYDWHGSAADMLTSQGVLYWKPSPGMSRSYADVPEHIAGAATEAFECHARQHYRASILLCRSVIEATTKAKGITKGNLAAKINEMESQELVRKHIRVAADNVRAFGNDMAHGDFVEPVSEEESEQVISLMEVILDEVFQSHAKIDRTTAAVEARKKAQNLSP